ncbi:ATP-dependent zinc metalloprotease FtsH 1 [Zostera marina]|uniref:ATP-dependent zinc metalloprotease FtsH 1 n=1 Tax=Zostera marina TaxID=29655 RepID=A0A0K9PYL6_ZOSMR|nr:ATP-dependent zinc metalloprotease FtsH 1 [Zostera marina]
MEDGWLQRIMSSIATISLVWVMLSRYLETFNLNEYISILTSKLFGYFYPYINIKFPEQGGDKLKRSEAYTAIEEYLGTICVAKGKRFKAEIRKENKNWYLSMDDKEEIIDNFNGIKFWWGSNSQAKTNTSISFYPSSDVKRHYRLTFHRQHKEVGYIKYLNHVIETGKKEAIKKRQRKLYTNNPEERGYREKLWIHVPFEHPSTFETLAMDPNQKREIIDDLVMFSRNKDYYKRIGKAWKRGYLLYGPPGTGKSSMIAAMANFLDYSIYDLELTAVKNNSMLRKLLIATEGKSIIVIEDIDCSLDVTEKRKKAKKKKSKEEEEKDEIKGKKKDDNDSKVTLSGLLNFIDGLWSACGGERLIIFTTNHVKKLDPALIRRGRMDKHIELSYCGFEAFKVLAYNYLDIKQHPLFVEVENLMVEVKITPADVAENLIPKHRLGEEEDATICLENLIQTLVEFKANPILEDLESDDDDDKREEEETIKKEDEDKDEEEEEN